MAESEKFTGTPVEKRLQRMQHFWIPAEHAYNQWAIQAKEDFNFYLGGENQWSATDLETLKAQNRPALTFNHLLALVNLVSGFQRQNRADIKIFNRKGGTRLIADILTKIIKHIEDNSYGDYESSMAFLMGIITGRGFIAPNLDFDDDVLNGDIIVQSHSPFRVYPDPHAERYDNRDAMFIFNTSWLPKSRIELAFPEKVKELEALGSVGGAEREILTISEGDKYHDADGTNSAISQIEKYRYRVKQCWWKKFETQKFLIGIESGKVRRVDMPEAKIKKLIEQNQSLRFMKRVRPVLNLTTYVGNVELEHQEDPLNGIIQLPIIPFYAYKVEHENFGIITQLKDAQREINKRLSQALHHLNQSANSGWVGDEDALPPDGWDQLENFGAKPGTILKLKKGTKLERMHPSPISDGHLVLAQSGKQNIRDISGVNPDLAGVPSSKQESGVLAELRRAQGLTALESIFDNFRHTKQILGNLYVDMIQKTDAYSQEEMLNMVVDDQGMEPNLKAELEKRGIEQIKKDLSIGKYKVVVGRAANSPTVRARNFQIMVELATKGGVQIPPEMLLDASDLPNKEQLMEAIKNQPKPVVGGGGAT